MKLECWGASGTLDAVSLGSSLVNGKISSSCFPTIKDRNLKEIATNCARGLVTFGSHLACDVHTAGGDLTGALFQVGKKSLFVPCAEDTWLCLQDVCTSVPLRDGTEMELRVADGICGRSLHVEIRGDSVVVSDDGRTPCALDLAASQPSCLAHDGALIFKGSLNIGRGRGASSTYKAKEQGFMRCAINRDLAYVPKTLSCIRKTAPGATGFWLEPHCDDTRRDPERLRSTWLHLATDVAYYIPSGARDEHVALSIAGELFVVASSAQTARLRNPSHTPPLALCASISHQLWRTIYSSLAERIASLCLPKSIQYGGTLATCTLLGCMVLSPRGAATSPTPSMSDAISALADKHDLLAYRDALQKVLGELGCEYFTDFKHLVDDPDISRQFIDMCEGFPKNRIKSLLDDVRDAT